MSHKIAHQISRETHHHVEWAPANREYVVWPEGIPCATPEEARRVVYEQDEPRQIEDGYIEINER